MGEKCNTAKYLNIKEGIRKNKNLLIIQPEKTLWETNEKKNVSLANLRKTNMNYKVAFFRIFNFHFAFS